MIDISDCKEPNDQNMVIAESSGLLISGVCTFRVEADKARYYLEHYNQLEDEGFVENNDDTVSFHHNGTEIKFSADEAAIVVGQIQSKYSQ